MKSLIKLFLKTNISRLIIFITIVLFFISIYFAYHNYHSYVSFEKILKHNTLSSHVNNLLESLAKERLSSILYLTKPNQTKLRRLQEKRKEVDLQFKNNKNLELTQESKDLIDIRKKINSRTSNPRLFVYEKFHINLFKKILIKTNKLKIFENKPNELQLLKLRENINMENSFLAFILEKKKPITTTEDIQFWEKILYLRELVTFTSIKDEALLAHLEKTYDINNFAKIAQNERVEILIVMKNSHYPFNFKQWFQKTSQQQTTINTMLRLLIDDDEYLKDERVEHIGEMYRSIIISLLILILLGLLISILFILEKMSKEERMLKDTVKEIEVDLDEKKKREIKEILTHNSSIEVYEFLANEIKEPSRAKDLFLANMSHEIRTPLNGIIGFTKELKETKLSEEQEEIVNIIEESSDNLMHIVNDILDFSKIKAGKVKIENIEFDPIEKFEASIDTFVAKAREKEIELKVCIDPQIPTQILGDPTKIIQILNNLISNAIKFTPTKGNIEVSVKKITENKNKDTTIQFSVQDSGIGVSAEQKKKIFNAFSQADASTSRKYGGTGLGLSIASQFIKHMGGKLNIESKVGEGARFFFSITVGLPKNIENRPKKDLTTYTIGYIPPTNNRSVDKNLKTYIEYQGATFLTYSQRTLLNLEETDLPDLIFIDYKCFDSEGEIEYFLELPLKVVLIVADNREEELLSIRSKIDKILHKPVNFTRTIKSLEVLTKTKEAQLDKKPKTLVKQFMNARALVAEDNLINQKLMKSVLNRLGIEVTIVSNGVEAIKSLEKNVYDIIFMDIQMPVMGGVEATRSILNLEKVSNKKHIPIIALTANALAGDKEKYMAIGIDAYLSKPMNLDKLKKVLNNFLN